MKNIFFLAILSICLFSTQIRADDIDYQEISIELGSVANFVQFGSDATIEFQTDLENLDNIENLFLSFQFGIKNLEIESQTMINGKNVDEAYTFSYEFVQPRIQKQIHGQELRKWCKEHAKEETCQIQVLISTEGKLADGESLLDGENPLEVLGFYQIFQQQMIDGESYPEDGESEQSEQDGEQSEQDGEQSEQDGEDQDGEQQDGEQSEQDGEQSEQDGEQSEQDGEQSEQDGEQQDGEQQEQVQIVKIQKRRQLEQIVDKYTYGPMNIKGDSLWQIYEYSGVQALTGVQGRSVYQYKFEFKKDQIVGKHFFSVQTFLPNIHLDIKIVQSVREPHNNYPLFSEDEIDPTKFQNGDIELIEDCLDEICIYLVSVQVINNEGQDGVFYMNISKPEQIKEGETATLKTSFEINYAYALYYVYAHEFIDYISLQNDENSIYRIASYNEEDDLVNYKEFFDAEEPYVSFNHYNHNVVMLMPVKVSDNQIISSISYNKKEDQYYQFQPLIQRKKNYVYKYVADGEDSHMNYMFYQKIAPQYTRQNLLRFTLKIKQGEGLQLANNHMYIEVAENIRGRAISKKHEQPEFSKPINQLDDLTLIDEANEIYQADFDMTEFEQCYETECYIFISSRYTGNLSQGSYEMGFLLEPFEIPDLQNGHFRNVTLSSVFNEFIVDYTFQPDQQEQNLLKQSNANNDYFEIAVQNAEYTKLKYTVYLCQTKNEYKTYEVEKRSAQVLDRIAFDELNKIDECSKEIKIYVKVDNSLNPEFVFEQRYTSYIQIRMPFQHIEIYGAKFGSLQPYKIYDDERHKGYKKLEYFFDVLFDGSRVLHVAGNVGDKFHMEYTYDIYDDRDTEDVYPQDILDVDLDKIFSQIQDNHAQLYIPRCLSIEGCRAHVVLYIKNNKKEGEQAQFYMQLANTRDQIVDSQITMIDNLYATNTAIQYFHIASESQEKNNVGLFMSSVLNESYPDFTQGTEAGKFLVFATEKHQKQNDDGESTDSDGEDDDDQHLDWVKIGEFELGKSDLQIINNNKDYHVCYYGNPQYDYQAYIDYNNDKALGDHNTIEIEKQDQNYRFYLQHTKQEDKITIPFEHDWQYAIYEVKKEKELPESVKFTISTEVDIDGEIQNDFYLSYKEVPASEKENLVMPVHQNNEAMTANEKTREMTVPVNQDKCQDGCTILVKISNDLSYTDDRIVAYLSAQNLYEGGEPKKGGSNTGLIVGLVLGFVALLAILIGLWFYRRKKLEASENTNQLLSEDVEN